MTDRARALVVLNPLAHGGAAARRFEPVRPIVAATLDARIVVGSADGAWREEVRAALADGVRTFVAAGGDGTVHALLNALVDAPRRPALDEITLGAIGLGSSNDLHKPASHVAAGVPLRLDAGRAALRDVVRCEYRGASGSRRTHLLVSASLGVSAAANARFASSAPFATLLRRASTTAAISWAALRSIALWRDLDARVAVDSGAAQRVRLASLGVLKTQWLSGALRFGGAVAPDSGDFDVVLVQGLGRGRLLLDVVALLRGRFDGRAGHRRWRARSLEVTLEADAPIEFDGEVDVARVARFDVLRERIRLCA